MINISMILGAGFSQKAGLPLAKEIDGYFLRNNEETLLAFSSGEWKWIDFANDAYRNNGRLNFDWLPFGFILNCLVAKYQESTGSFISYEDFYQFCLDHKVDYDFYDNIYKTAHENFDKINRVEKTSSFYPDYTYAFEHPDSSEILNLLNHLIDDLLYWRKDGSEIISAYEPFLNFIRPLSNFTIITLNHDFLIEALVKEHMGKEFSDGFSISGTTLFSTGGKPIKIFNGDFEQPFNLIKLHGSLDLYKFIVADNQGANLFPTGEIIYFKTIDYHEKHMTVRKDLTTGEILQNFNINFSPQFVTGTRKEELIATDYMYKSLYEQSDKKLSETKILLIIGYSFGDPHVNKMIEKSVTTGNLEQIININPVMTFPYNSVGIDLKNLSSIYDMSTL
jgi:SIR2-like domain